MAEQRTIDPQCIFRTGCPHGLCKAKGYCMGSGEQPTSKNEVEYLRRYGKLPEYAFYIDRGLTLTLGRVMQTAANEIERLTAELDKAHLTWGADYEAVRLRAALEVARDRIIGFGGVIEAVNEGLSAPNESPEGQKIEQVAEWLRGKGYTVTAPGGRIKDADNYGT